MARHLSEMMLIVRAQNQASGALRRVGKDLSALGRHRALQIRQQQLLLNQQKLMRQRQRALNELDDITNGTRAINLRKAAVALERQRNTLATRRRSILRDSANLTSAMSAGMERMKKVDNDLYRNETRRLILKNKMKAAEAAEAKALRNRKELLKSAGGLKNVPKSDDVFSKDAITNARNRGNIIQRLLVGNILKNEELAASAAQLGRAQERHSSKAKELGHAFHGTATQATNLALAEDKLAAAHRKEAARARLLHSELRDIASSYAIANAHQKELARTIHVAKWDRLSTLGRTIQHIGRVGQYATLVFGGGLAYAAHQAAMFESSVTKVATQTGKVDANFGRTTATIVRNSKMLQKAFIGIQMDSTSSMEQITEAGYDLFSTLDQLGESTAGLKRGTGILKLFSDAAIAGGTDINTVGDGVIATLSAFDEMPQTVGSVQKLLNRMFATVRFGRMTFAQFAATLGTTTPAAKAAGQSFDTMAGTIAFLSKPLGINKASVGFARLTEILSRKKFVDGLKKAGVSIVDANGKMLQMPDIIDKITTKFPELTKGGVKLMQFFKELSGTEGTIQARRAFVFLAQDLEGYRRITQKVVSDNNEMDRSLKTMEATTGVRWEKFMNQLRAAVLMIGSEVLPEILKLAPHIQRLVDWFTGLSPEVRSTAVHMVAVGVAAMAIASAVMFLAGPLIRMIALLGKGRVLFLGLGVGLAAVTVAIGVITGDWNTLNRVVDEFFGLTDQGAWGWVAMFGIATLGALRLAKAVKSVQMAWKTSAGLAAAGQGVGGMAGMFSSGRRGAGNVRDIGKIARESGKLKALLFGASMAAAGLGAPLLVAGGAIAVAAAGAYLWKRHMDGVKKAAQEVKNLNLQATAPGRAADRASTTGDRIRDVKQAQLQIKAYDLQLLRLVASVKTLHGIERQEALLNISQVALDRSRAVQSLNTAYQNLRVSVGAFTDYLTRQKVAEARIGEQQMRIIELQKERARLMRTGFEGDDPAIQSINRSIETARRNINAWSRELINADLKMRSGFNKSISVMQQLGMLPARISPQLRQMAFDFQRQMGRMMSPAELKKFFKVALNLDTTAANNKMGIFIRNWQAKKIKISADLKIAAGQAGKLTPAEILSQGKGPVKRGVLQIPAAVGKVKLPRNVFGGLKIPPITPKAKPAPARKTIEMAFKTPIKQKINVVIPAQGALAGLGSSIVSGVAAGVDANDAISAAMVRKVLQARAAAGDAVGEGSPAKLFIPLGISIIDGIIKGLLQKNKIERTAALVMDLFNGAFLQKKNEKIEAIGDKGEFDPLKLKEYLQRQKDALAKYKKSKKEIDKIRAEQYGEKAKKMSARRPGNLTATDLIKDAQGQVKAMLSFNKSLEQLKRRGAPVGLLNDLRALGVDGLKYIKLLADASPAQLKKYIRAWNQMQGQVRRSQYQTLEDIKNWKQSTLDQLKEFKDAAAQKLLDTWNELRSIAENNMGELFQGLEAKVGEGFQSAVDEWQSRVDDYRSQIEDLQGQIKDVHESFQQAFGQLFQGDFLQNDAGVASKREWGVALGFDDLLADLKGQTQRFKDWQATLTSLAGKLPADLAAQLKDLGPEALESLKTLDGATAEQLAQYVSSWREGQDAIGQATINATKDLATNIQNLTDTLNNLLSQAPKALTGDDIIAGIQKQIAGFDNFEAVLQALRNKGLPEELVKQIAQMGPDALPYMNALNNMTTTQLGTYVGLWQTAQQKINTATDRLMQDQLNLWLQHGKNIAAAIIAGVASEQQALLTFFGNLFQNLLEGKVPNMPGTGSSAPVNYLPGHPNPGQTDPWQWNLPGAGKSAASSSPVQMAPANLSSGPNVTIGPVYATQDESLEQVLSRAAFNVRNTYAE